MQQVHRIFDYCNVSASLKHPKEGTGATSFTANSTIAMSQLV